MESPASLESPDPLMKACCILAINSCTSWLLLLDRSLESPALEASFCTFSLLLLERSLESPALEAPCSSSSPLLETLLGSLEFLDTLSLEVESAFWEDMRPPYHAVLQ